MELRFPPIYLLHNEHLPVDKLIPLEKQIGKETLRYNVREAKIILAKGVTKERRVILELERLGVEPTSIHNVENFDKVSNVNDTPEQRPNKRRKLSKTSDGQELIVLDSSTESEEDESPKRRRTAKLHFSKSSNLASGEDDLFSSNTAKFLKLNWYLDSIKAGKLLPTNTPKYLIWEGILKEKPVLYSPTATLLPQQGKRETILARARADTPPRENNLQHKTHCRNHRSQNSQGSQRPPLLREETTGDHEIATNLPLLPPFYSSPYSCQWRTPLNGANDEFIDQLRNLRDKRILMLDDRISADAKSKAMAAVAAYPYTITSWHEVERLPGCGPSHAALFEEWKTTGRIREVDELKHDEKFQSLKIFYDIYDVAGKTARDFYRRGWRDLDDLIMNWESLTENQRVGVKYYDDFKEKIPRAEVEQIGAVVLQYANRIQKGFQMVITGGYRRGKSMSGDVDVILTHPDKEATKDFIDEIVYDLGKDLWITQRLSLTTRNSHRGQAPVTWKGSMPRSGSGFDTLDKALVVWQNASLLLPDGKPDPNVRNPKRRVDIIISPWKTAGCAILGWSGGTQFERDLRKYVRTLNPPLKFDSTGVVNRETGKWIDFEGDETDLLEKEKSVFKGLKLEWRDPTERCTG